MSNIIRVKIDVTKINKTRLFKGKNGTYLELVLIPKTTETNFGDSRDEQTHMVCQSVTKEERAAGKRGEILGNAVELSGAKLSFPNQSEPKPAPAVEDDDIPF